MLSGVGARSGVLSRLAGGHEGYPGFRAWGSARVRASRHAQHEHGKKLPLSFRHKTADTPRATLHLDSILNSALPTTYWELVGELGTILGRGYVGVDTQNLA